MVEKFLAKYFPPSKTAKLRNEILAFQQNESESLYEAWERYKDLLRRVPNHELPLWMQVQTFYNGVTHSTRVMIDASAGGAVMNKSPQEAYALFEEMAGNAY